MDSKNANQGLVTCDCSTSGIFKLSVTNVQVIDQVLFSKVAIRLNPAQEVFSIIFVTVVAFILAALTSVSLILLCSMVVEQDGFAFFEKIKLGASNIGVCREPLDDISDFSLNRLDSGFLPQFFDPFIENAYSQLSLLSPHSSMSCLQSGVADQSNRPVTYYLLKSAIPDVHSNGPTNENESGNHLPDFVLMDFQYIPNNLYLGDGPWNHL